MSLLSRLAAVFRPQASTVSDRVVSTADLERLLRAGWGTHSGVTVSRESSESVAAVFACSHLICSALAGLPFDTVKKANDRRREIDHPVARLLGQRPNIWQTPSQFRYQMTEAVIFRGNAYARVLRNARGTPVELWPLDPDRVTPKMETPDAPLSYEVRPAKGGTFTLQARDVLHLRSQRTRDGFTGLPLMDAAREHVGLSLAARNMGASYFRNGTIVGATLETDQKVAPDVHERLQNSLEEFRGSTKAFRTMVLEQGLSFKPIEVKLTDSQLFDAMRHSRAEICMFFGVPPRMIGAMDGTAANAISAPEHDGLSFVTYCLGGWLTLWEEAITRDLLGPEALGPEPVQPKFNVSALLRADLETRYKSYAIGLQQGFMTPNQVAALEDWEPVEGGDVLRFPVNAIPLEFAQDYGRKLSSEAAPLPQAVPDEAEARNARLLADLTALIAGQPASQVTVEAPQVTVEAPQVNVTLPAPGPRTEVTTVVARDDKGRATVLEKVSDG